MEVEYVLTVEDHLAFTRHQLASRRGVRMHISWVWLGLLLLMLVLVSLPFFTDPAPQQPPPERDTGHLLIGLAPLAVAVVLVVVFLVWGKRYFVTNQIKRLVTDPANRKRLLGWRRTSMGPEGLVNRGEDIDVTLSWAAIQKIALTPQHAVFYLSDLEAIIVPRRPFAGDEEFKKFVATAHDYWEKAEDASPDPKPTRRKDVREADTGITPDEAHDR